MLSKLVKNKEEAFKNGTEIINDLRQEFFIYSKDLISKNLMDVGINNLSETDNNRYIGLNVIDVTSYIYNSPKFYEYLKYSFLGKYYNRKISNIELLIILLFVLIGVVIFFIFGFGVIFIISAIALLLGALAILHFVFKTGENYVSYYNRTFLQFLLEIYSDLGFTINNNKSLTNGELDIIIDNSYDKKECKNNIDFSGNLYSGNILDLRLIRTTKKKNGNGSVTEHDDMIFDGFYLKIDTVNNHNVLRGNTIKIRCDENIFSSLAEDTVRGIYESNREISFNSEEMNKSFDARISGYIGFNSVDDIMIQVQKILTPSFEQHLLYLRERYNSFNMNITDSGIVATFNMDRSFFQKVKHNEVLDFKTTYREANKYFRMLRTDINGIDDFAYYNVFPFLERLYLIKYLTYLYLSIIDFNNYYSFNNSNINSFEESMRAIYTIDNKEFKQFYTDKIKEIKDNTKDFAMRFESEVK